VRAKQIAQHSRTREHRRDDTWDLGFACRRSLVPPLAGLSRSRSSLPFIPRVSHKVNSPNVGKERISDRDASLRRSLTSRRTGIALPTLNKRMRWGRGIQRSLFLRSSSPSSRRTLLSLYRFFRGSITRVLLNTPSYPPSLSSLRRSPRRPLLGPVNPSCNPFLFRTSRTLRALTYDGRVKFNEGDRCAPNIPAAVFEPSV